jgi:hypothetical protein
VHLLGGGNAEFPHVEALLDQEVTELHPVLGGQGLELCDLDLAPVLALLEVVLAGTDEAQLLGQIYHPLYVLINSVPLDQSWLGKLSSCRPYSLVLCTESNLLQTLWFVLGS